MVAHAPERGLLSDERFTVDGTLIEAWASVKSFKRADAPPPRRIVPAIPRRTSTASAGTMQLTRR